MTRWITADHVFDGHDLLAGQALRIEDGCVAEIAPVTGAADHLGYLVTPGFFDIQVNGGGGVLFNAEPTPDGAAKIAQAHRTLGTTHVLPTVITDTPEVLEAAVQAVLQAHGTHGILGIHIEGPHIALSRRGTHAAQYIRPLDDRTRGLLRRLRAADVPVLLTLAPEATGPGDIAALVAMGVTVSLGHTDATLEQIRAAEAEGAQAFTHLYNAMSPMTSRAPGAVGAAITSDKYCSAIFDGIHVAPEMLRIACGARPRPDRMIMVSDAMPSVAGPDSFALYGQTLRVADGRIVNSEGALAGAHVSMAASLANAVRLVGIGLEDALRMAITHPHALMQTRLGGGLIGQPVSDLIVLGNDLGLHAGFVEGAR